MQLVTITTKGQVTIPVKIREKLGLNPGDRVIFDEDKNVAQVRPVPDFFTFRGALKGKGPYGEEKVRKTVGEHLAKRYLRTLNKS